MRFTWFTKQVNLQPPVSTTLYPESLFFCSWDVKNGDPGNFYDTFRDEISETDHHRRALSKKIIDQLKLFRASKGKITTLGTKINTFASIFVGQG